MLHMFFLLGGHSIIPFFVLPHFPHFPLLVFNVFFFVFVTTMFLIFQGGSAMINGFVSRPPFFPFGFCYFSRGGGGGKFD